MSNKCAIFVANRGFALTSSRLLLIQHFISIGWKVVAVVSNDNYTKILSDHNVIVEPVEFNRGGLDVNKDIKALKDLIRIYSKYKPDLIHHFNAKPMMFGCIASLFIKDVKVINTITGLGNAFVSEGFVRRLAVAGYKFFVSRSDAIIFQNPDDLELFVEKKWVPEYKAKLIISSGVDINRFYPENFGDGESTRVLMVSRLLWQKGIFEYVEAAKIIKENYPSVRLQLAGEWDLGHPDSIDKEWLQKAIDNGIIEFLGYINYMEKRLQLTDIFVLPSYYREGVPRVLLEAAACGVPVITTDWPGCREAVEEGKTGFLVPPQDSNSLANAILKLVSNPDKQIKMGISARRKAEKEFDINIITPKMLNTYREVGLDFDDVE